MQEWSVVELAVALIERPSITPHDAGCQQIIANFLTPLGFSIESLHFGDTDNLFATHGHGSPLLILAGHTDVVPPGALDQWITPPFEPEIRDGHLYGRGAADMKGNIAAMLLACKKWITQYPEHPGTIALLLTSDEEGSALDGTQRVIKELSRRGITGDWCIVGEPSSHKQAGDTIKIGRRGSLNGRLVIQGQQGHIAYPQLANNPIHNTIPLLELLCNTQWDAGYPQFPPTTLQISNIHAGTGSTNVIPGTLEMLFNFRYSPAVTAEQLKERVVGFLDQHQIPHELTWQHSGLPFLTKPGELLSATYEAIQQVIGITPECSTDGGTSDARFIAPTGCQVIELGCCNHSIHKINECVAINDLEILTKVYEKILAYLIFDTPKNGKCFS